MPNYDFVCLVCDEDFEKNVPYDEVDRLMCEKCGYKVKRVYTFKGLVWSPTRNNGFS